MNAQTQPKMTMFYFDSLEKIRDYDSFRVKAVYLSRNLSATTADRTSIRSSATSGPVFNFNIRNSRSLTFHPKATRGCLQNSANSTSKTFRP